VKKQVDPVPNEYLRRPRRRTRVHLDSMPREKDNPSLGGVFSRPRSLVSNPDHLPDLPLPEEIHRTSLANDLHGTKSGSSSNSTSRSTSRVNSISSRISGHNHRPLTRSNDS
jgi:hypothetical protein